MREPAREEIHRAMTASRPFLDVSGDPPAKHQGKSTPACYACLQETKFATLPARERVAVDDLWRVAHAVNVAMPGWLVLLPRRHVVAIAELTSQEAASLGAWQVRLSRALHAVTECEKTYVVAFGEAEGFSHLHFHVVPRMAELAADLRGPGIFDLLRRPEGEHTSTAEMNRIALALRDEISVAEVRVLDAAGAAPDLR